MKIFIIGPIIPYRGGIAHSNTLLCKNLSKNNNVYCISFKRQFPKILYPGREQIDKNLKLKKNLNSFFIIDSINPLTWLQVFDMIRKEKPDLVTFQWWTPFFMPCYTTISFLTRRFTKARISAVCQNVVSHESRFIERFLTKIFFKTINFFITYSSSDKQDIKKLLKNAKVEWIVEGTYDKQLGTGIEKEVAKKKLGLKGKNIIFFGFVRPYKGLIYLIKAMQHIAQQYDVTLHIVGEFWEDKNRYTKEINNLGIGKNIKIVDRYVSDEEAVLYISAADVIVLPYTSSTESGIIQLAFGLNKPIITTDVGGNKDLVKNNINGILVKPKNSRQLADAVIKFYSDNMENVIKNNMKASRKIFLWTDKKERIFLGGFK